MIPLVTADAVRPLLLDWLQTVRARCEYLLEASRTEEVWPQGLPLAEGCHRAAEGDRHLFLHPVRSGCFGGFRGSRRSGRTWRSSGTNLALGTVFSGRTFFAFSTISAISTVYAGRTRNENRFAGGECHQITSWLKRGEQGLKIVARLLQLTRAEGIAYFPASPCSRSGSKDPLFNRPSPKTRLESRTHKQSDRGLLRRASTKPRGAVYGLTVCVV